MTQVNDPRARTRRHRGARLLAVAALVMASCFLTLSCDDGTSAGPPLIAGRWDAAFNESTRTSLPERYFETTLVFQQDGALVTGTIEESEFGFVGTIRGRLFGRTFVFEVLPDPPWPGELEGTGQVSMDGRALTATFARGPHATWTITATR